MLTKVPRASSRIAPPDAKDPPSETTSTSASFVTSANEAAPLNEMPSPMERTSASASAVCEPTAWAVICDDEVTTPLSRARSAPLTSDDRTRDRDAHGQAH